MHNQKGLAINEGFSAAGRRSSNQEETDEYEALRRWVEIYERSLLARAVAELTR